MPVMTTSSASGPRRAPTVLRSAARSHAALRAVEQGFPFRTDDYPGEAEQLLKQGLVRRVIADVVVAIDAPDSREIRVSAVSLLLPDTLGASASWVVGFGSAAWLHTGCDGERPLGPAALEVIIPPGRRRPKLAGIRGRQVALSPDQVIFLGPVPVTDPVRTAADVARDLPADAAVPALRRLGELCEVRPTDVLQLLATMRYARGAATARRVIKAWTDEP
jgi:hypothetical protein